MRHVLAHEGAPERLVAVIIVQDVWRSLTKVQRSALLNPDRPVKPATRAALARKGLWDACGITTRGSAVVAWRPKTEERA